MCVEVSIRTACCCQKQEVFDINYLKNCTGKTNTVSYDEENILLSLLTNYIVVDKCLKKRRKLRGKPVFK